MFKRIMLTLTFAAAFGAAGLSLTDNAEARWRGWGRPYVSSYYYGPSYYYSGYPPYRTYYRSYYAPRSYYYDPYAYDDYYYRPAPRVAVRVGGPWWR